jgi:hypothetical protein
MICFSFGDMAMLVAFRQPYLCLWNFFFHFQLKITKNNQRNGGGQGSGLLSSRLSQPSKMDQWR